MLLRSTTELENEQEIPLSGGQGRRQALGWVCGIGNEPTPALRATPEAVKKLNLSALTTEAPNLQQRKTRAERAFHRGEASAPRHAFCREEPTG
jgi:hypothetical protein